MPHTRVIVGTYNQVPVLEFVLRGYLRQTTTDFSLVLADDGSGQEQIDFVERWRSKFMARGIPFEHVWQEDLGWRKNHALNESVRRAGDESLLVFSDGDCVPPAHFVERHIEVHEPWSFHVGGGIRWNKELSARLTTNDVESGRFEAFTTADDWKPLRIRARKSRWGTLVRRKNRPKVIGLNMGCDRRFFEAVNGFDEVFEWPYFGEDSDLRDRVMRHRPRPRVKVLYTTNDVYHVWHPLKETGRAHKRDYYDQRRPIRCEKGLVRTPQQDHRSQDSLSRHAKNIP